MIAEMKNNANNIYNQGFDKTREFSTFGACNPLTQIK